MSDEIVPSTKSGIAVSTDGDMIIGGFAFTPTALVPADPNSPPDFEAWDSVGTFLRYVHTGSQFWIGDWLNYGESNYGERYAQAVEHTGYELHTLQSYAWAARQVPRSNRLEAVPFGHYVNGIAALPPDQQAKWAKRVVDEGLSQSQLKAELNKERAANGGKPTDLWLVVLCKSQADFDKLEKQMRDQGREVTCRITPRKAEKKPKAPKAAKPAKAAKPTSAITKKAKTEKPPKVDQQKTPKAKPFVAGGPVYQSGKWIKERKQQPGDLWEFWTGDKWHGAFASRDLARDARLKHESKG